MDTWYSFECSFAGCPSAASSGTIVEVRIPWENLVPTIYCPVCGTRMNHRDFWPASKSGHGSHADFDSYLAMLDAESTMDKSSDITIHPEE